jgi:ribosomal protein S18 acetylase RimI-like enzyme
MKQDQFRIDVSPDTRDVEYLRDRIDTFNVDETKIYDFKQLAIFMRDSMGQMIAGIYAYTWGGCLDIRFLWVRADSRGAGLGTKLMRAAEHEAIARGCNIATLETHSFQAPGFYKKLGYKKIGVLDGYPVGHEKYYLKKILSAP